MKSLILVAALVAAPFAMANEHGEAAHDAAPAAAEATKAAKMDKKAAKAACLQENAKMKGAELKKCIHSKTM